MSNSFDISQFKPEVQNFIKSAGASLGIAQDGKVTLTELASILSNNGVTEVEKLTDSIEISKNHIIGDVTDNMTQIDQLSKNHIIGGVTDKMTQIDQPNKETVYFPKELLEKIITIQTNFLEASEKYNAMDETTQAEVRKDTMEQLESKAEELFNNFSKAEIIITDERDMGMPFQPQLQAALDDPNKSANDVQKLIVNHSLGEIDHALSKMERYEKAAETAFKAYDPVYHYSNDDIDPAKPQSSKECKDFVLRLLPKMQEVTLSSKTDMEGLNKLKDYAGQIQNYLETAFQNIVDRCTERAKDYSKEINDNMQALDGQIMQSVNIVGDSNSKEFSTIALKGATAKEAFADVVNENKKGATAKESFADEKKGTLAGISSTKKANAQHNGKTFTLEGIEVPEGQTVKGQIYIKDGKKFIAK